MRIVADENIPFAREAFAPFGDVDLLPGRSITSRDLQNADALVVRSVTRVDRSLLDGTAVRFVGTATIGVDHIDLDYLRGSAIAFADGAGSNARSVAEYVVAAMLELRSRGILTIEGRRLGVVGVGNVGNLVGMMGRALGMTVIEHDPPRAAAEQDFHSAPLEELLDCDVITLHVPLVFSVPHATYHLIDGSSLKGMRAGAVLINTSRGGVVRSQALIEALRSGSLRAAVVDVWEDEPDVPKELIERCAIATPHIAGYSFDGKARGTEMMVEALVQFTGTEQGWHASDALGERVGNITLPKHLLSMDQIHHAVHAACDIVRDDTDLRSLLDLPDAERRAGFDRLRRDYRERREFPAYTVATDDEQTLRMTAGLGFRVPTELNDGFLS